MSESRSARSACTSGPATTACAPWSSARRGLPSDSHRTPKRRSPRCRRRTYRSCTWTGASWGKAATLSLDRPELAGDFPIVQALVRRALELDESWNFGAIHVAMISLEALPASMGGDRDRAARHYERAVALTRGNGAVPHLSYATGVLLPQQKRAEFVALLQKALAVDVDVERPLRLENILAQQYARYLLDHLDALFLSDKELEHASAR